MREGGATAEDLCSFFSFCVVRTRLQQAPYLLTRAPLFLSSLSLKHSLSSCVSHPSFFILLCIHAFVLGKLTPSPVEGEEGELAQGTQGGKHFNTQQTLERRGAPMHKKKEGVHTNTKRGGLTIYNRATVLWSKTVGRIISQLIGGPPSKQTPLASVLICTVVKFHRIYKRLHSSGGRGVTADLISKHSWMLLSHLNLKICIWHFSFPQRRKHVLFW